MLPLACYKLISMKDKETRGNVPGVLKRAGMRWYHQSGTWRCIRLVRYVR